MLCIDLIKRKLNRDEQQFNCEQQNEPLFKVHNTKTEANRH